MQPVRLPAVRGAQPLDYNAHAYNPASVYATEVPTADQASARWAYLDVPGAPAVDARQSLRETDAQVETCFGPARHASPRNRHGCFC